MAAEDVAVVSAPSAGVWRVARADRPLHAEMPKAVQLRSRAAGNRYDVPGVRTLYFSSTLIGCYTKVLAPLRPKPELRELVEAEWSASSHFKPGWVTASWRHRRTEVKVKISHEYEFLDVEDVDTLDVLSGQLTPALAALGHSDLDFGLIHGPDRRVTRLIAAWAEQVVANDKGDDGDDQLRFAGIRYRSRLNQDELCWAVWSDGVEIAEVERRAVERESVELRQVSERFKLWNF